MTGQTETGRRSTSLVRSEEMPILRCSVVGRWLQSGRMCGFFLTALTAVTAAWPRTNQGLASGNHAGIRSIPPLLMLVLAGLLADLSLIVVRL